MVCTYCASPTQVVNSRLQKQANQVWRRRQCRVCRAVFTTQEAVELATSLVVHHSPNTLRPFSREKLFISIYESCKHRANPITDASALTQTVLSKLQALHQEGILARQDIVETTHAVLARFDTVASTMYRAYHT